MSRADTEQGRVLTWLGKRRNGASERQVNDNVLPLETAAHVRGVLDAMAGKGEAVCRLDEKGARRYYAGGKAPLQYGRQARQPAPRPTAPTNPEVRPPRSTPPETPPVAPPKVPRKLRPKADMPQPVAFGPADIIARDVSQFLARGGEIQRLDNGAASQKFKVIGTEKCPVKPALYGRRFRSSF